MVRRGSYTVLFIGSDSHSAALLNGLAATPDSGIAKVLVAESIVPMQHYLARADVVVLAPGSDLDDLRRCRSELDALATDMPLLAFATQSDTDHAILRAAGAADVLPAEGLTAPLLERAIAAVVERARADRREAESVSLYQRLFETAPDSCLVVAPVTWQIVAVSDSYLAATNTRRERILHRRLFEVFPDDPDEPGADGAANLLASLERVVALHRADAMPVQRYPIPRAEEQGGGFEERFWSVVNTPVFGDDGALQCIVHRAEDVTPLMNPDVEAPSAEWRSRLDHDVVLRSRELQQANVDLAKGQRLLRIAGRAARFGGWSYDVATQQLTWSDEVYRIHEAPLSYTPTVDAGVQFYAPEHREVIAKAVQRCIKEGEAFDVQLQLQTMKGRRLWVRAIGEPVRDDQGRITMVEGAFQDIDAQVRDRAAAMQSAERLSATLETISDAFFTLDRNWIFTYVNRQAERLLQRSREELLGANVWIEFPEAVGSSFDRAYRQVLTEQVDVAFEEYYPPLERWFDVRAYPAYDGGVAVYFRDATARRESETQLRMLQSSVERLNDIVVITEAEPISDPGPRIVYVNEAFIQRTGYSREEVIGKSPRFLQGPGTDRRTLDRIRECLERWEPVRAELLNYTKDGRELWLELDISPVADASGWYTHWVAVERDVGERKAAESRLRRQAALLDHAQDAILVRDLEHRVLFWNRAAEEMYGYSSTEAIGRSIRDLLYRDTDAFDNAFEQLLAHEHWSGELMQSRRDGRQMLVESRWTLMRDADGRAESVLVVNTDVTERRRVEQQFLRAQRMESIGTLAGGIAHDLNNVLAPILMSVELLRMTATDPETIETLDLVASSAKRGAQMVGQVLSFARGVDGNHAPVQPRLLLRDITKIITDTFPKNIRIETQLPGDLWPVQGDATQLHQVLLNLCVNARDAMPAGGTLRLAAANVTIDAQYAAMNIDAKIGPYLRLDVEDSGEGIAPAILDKIFDPFFTTKEVGKGTGLGLATSLAIVKSHCGFIRPYSDLGSGTRMRVYLPALPDAQPDLSSQPESELPRGKGELVLVVDDEHSIRQVTRQTLEAFGYAVIVAADGSEAVSIYAKRGHEIAVVITDMMMPVMDGVATIQVLKRLDPDVRIVAASGITANGHVARAAEVGIKHFLPKPYTTETLLRVLRKVLDRE